MKYNILPVDLIFIPISSLQILVTTPPLLTLLNCSIPPTLKYAGFGIITLATNHLRWRRCVSSWWFTQHRAAGRAFLSLFNVIESFHLVNHGVYHGFSGSLKIFIWQSPMGASQFPKRPISGASVCFGAGWRTTWRRRGWRPTVDRVGVGSIRSWPQKWRDRGKATSRERFI